MSVGHLKTRGCPVLWTQARRVPRPCNLDTVREFGVTICRTYVTPLLLTNKRPISSHVWACTRTQVALTVISIGLILITCAAVWLKLIGRPSSLVMLVVWMQTGNNPRATAKRIGKLFDGWQKRYGRVFWIAQNGVLGQIPQVFHRQFKINHLGWIVWTNVTVEQRS